MGVFPARQVRLCGYGWWRDRGGLVGRQRGAAACSGGGALARGQWGVGRNSTV